MLTMKLPSARLWRAVEHSNSLLDLCQSPTGSLFPRLHSFGGGGGGGGSPQETPPKNTPWYPKGCFSWPPIHALACVGSGSALVPFPSARLSSRCGSRIEI